MVASVHQSHAYLDGACLYFTFAGRAPDRSEDPAAAQDADDAYYRSCWQAATAVIEQSGSAISHHHGIGLNRSRFMATALGSAFPALVAIKAALDPTGILNPGKLGLGSQEAW